MVSIWRSSKPYQHRPEPHKLPLRPPRPSRNPATPLIQSPPGSLEPLGKGPTRHTMKRLRSCPGSTPEFSL